MKTTLDLARIIVEAKAPLSIASGKADLSHDVLITRDAFGLPTIPGSALAGVLRTYFDEEEANWLFGKGREKDGKDKTREREKSRLSVSYGVVLDGAGKPVDGLARHIESKDTITNFLMKTQPIKRDHVKINDKGVSEDNAKFDRGAAPRGTRFYFELSIEREGDEGKDTLENIIKYLDAGIHIGGATRRGYGKLALVEAKWRSFDFNDANDREALKKCRGSFKDSFHALDGSKTKFGFETNAKDCFEFRLKLSDFWRTGSTEIPLLKNDNYEKLPKISSITEEKILWPTPKRGKAQKGGAKFNNLSQEGARLKKTALMPASGIKGPLKHRTLFHLHRLNNKNKQDQTIDEKALAPLFGFQKEGEEGSAGRLFLEDAEVDLKNLQTTVLWHNGIDRFTGGVRKGVLFSEEVIYQPELKISGSIKELNDLVEDHPMLMKAFYLAVRDLAEGRLALGAASAKGHGYGECSRFKDNQFFNKLEEISCE